MKAPEPQELKQLFRNLEAFRSLYESQGIDEIRSPSGDSWSLWDLEYLLVESRHHLTSRQHQAVRLCLIENRTEREVARIMGVQETSPVAIYATQGLKTLIRKMRTGELARYSLNLPAAIEVDERTQAISSIAEEIKSTLTYQANGCWAYPLQDPRAFPTITLRSSQSETGFIQVHPMWIMYQAHVESLQLDRSITHKPAPYYWRGCVNPDHAKVESVDMQVKVA